MTNDIVKVWDIPVRVFHWSLVVCFTLAYFTGEEDNQWHIYSGYIALGLVVFRILWGFIGSRHARFGDFIFSPGTVSAYIKSLGSATPIRYLGHTPPGGWMILALLASILLTTVSGLQVYGLEGHGPLAAGSTSLTLISPAYADREEHEHEEEEHENEAGEARHEDNEAGNENEVGAGSGEHGENGDDNEAEETWEEIHEFFSNLTVLLVLIHVTGVLVSSHLHKENLVKAMFTGNKERGGPDTHA